MNIRQNKYKQNRLMGMNMLNAALAAGYSRNYALQAVRLEKRVIESMEDILDQAGLTDRVLVKHIKSGVFEAVKPVDGENVPDWAIRHKYCETALKLKGKLKDNSLKDLGDAIKPVINIINSYGNRETDTNTSRVVPAQRVCIRDLEPSSKIQEHQLAPSGSQDNTGIKQADQGSSTES